MRRFAFYSSVTLLAFGIGIYSAVSFSLWKVDKLERQERESVDKVETNILTKSFGDARSDLRKNILEIQVEKQLSNEKKKTTFTCNDKLFQTVLRDLKKERDFNEGAKYYLEENNPSDCKDILFVEKLVDLNNDKNKEAIVRGKSWLLCGATGNCSTWIYGKFGNKYKKLLDTGGEILEVKKISTNGYKNIFVSVHDSCCSSYLETYKYNGAKYKEGSCLFEDYGTNGERNVMTCAEKTKQVQEESRQTESKLKNQ